jgi:hypothetical protein
MEKSRRKFLYKDRVQVARKVSKHIGHAAIVTGTLLRPKRLSSGRISSQAYYRVNCECGSALTFTASELTPPQEDS